MANNSLLDVNDMLKGYCDDVQDLISEEARRISLQVKQKLKSSSPKKTGSYAKGWSINTKRGRGYVKQTVWNKTDWQLTHLLEDGHRIVRNGTLVGVAGAKVHIKPVEEECIREFEENVKKIIESS